jgi:hypothetical protein
MLQNILNKIGNTPLGTVRVGSAMWIRLVKIIPESCDCEVGSGCVIMTNTHEQHFQERVY